MDLAEFTDPSLVREITSRTSTRSFELLHNRTQLFINQIISMDTKDHEDLLQSLPMFKTIKPAAKPNQLPKQQDICHIRCQNSGAQLNHLHKQPVHDN